MEKAPTDMPPFREWRAFLAYAMSHDAHPFIQFVKYGIAGVGALATDLAFFYMAEWLFFPIEKAQAAGMAMPQSLAQLGEWFHTMAQDLRVQNYIWCNVVGFAASNVVGYWLNVKFVFRGGKHHPAVEITLFVLVSFIAFVFGTALGSLLVGSFGLSHHLAKLGNIVAAILINYVCRKFLIFHG